ncbi:MAG: ABC transporter ATP-binding protein [Chloroflexota bacterium]|nr:MAG: ABC transporter ATP-binding protein [Chloroflexota bacterium]
MHIIRLEKVTASYASTVIFRDLSWAIDDRARIGLVGPNGAGKSTLLKLILGELPTDTGAVNRLRSATVGYLPQQVELTPDSTLIEEAMVMPPDLAQVEANLAKIEAQLSDPAVYNNADKLDRVLARQAAALQEYDHLGGARHQSRVREILSILGFTPDDDLLPTNTLSGGQKKLVALARLALEQPAVLLLDEPDNHLDVQAKGYLEAFINQYEGAVVIVSHDRYLLDEVATEIAELEDGKLKLYKGNYTAYTTERELQRLRQQQMYVAQQKEIARIEAAIARFELWASLVVNERHIKQARSRRRFLDKLEANGEIIEKVTDRRLMEFQLNGGRGSQKAIEALDLTMAFGDSLLFENINFLIQHGERVGLIGPNGAGKSVLFRLILGQMEPFDGLLKIGPSTKIGYYSQEHQTLDGWWDRTPIELIRAKTPKSEGDAVALLLKFAFKYEQTRLPIHNLSGGERSRLQLALLMLSGPNFLLLDEPTNNLDIASVEVLEAVMEDFEGAVLVISHDRYFLDRVVDRVLELEHGAMTGYLGGYTDYVEAVKSARNKPIRQRA